MAITVQNIVREFTYSGLTLQDPGPDFTPEEVRDIYSPQYPELATAAISGPDYSGNIAQYQFLRAVGSKGVQLNEKT